MNSLVIPPGLILILGGLLLPWLTPRLRSFAAIGFPLLTLMMVWLVTPEHSMKLAFLDYELDILHLTSEGRVFATVFAMMAGIGALYALKHARILELSAAFVYAGSAIGVTFCGDLISFFVFWEIMAIGSTLVIWANCHQNKRAYGASMRYLLVHLLGGVILMIGIAAHVANTGSVEFTAMKADNFATIMIMIGFLINAGAPPFSAWIADAYPEASPSGTVFLSAFTTKTAVFALLMGFPGESILIYVGMYMVFYGIIYALLENDMRRILAYSIVNQVGFMVVAIGIGSELALNGATAHAFAHIIYKGLLLMSAGSVLLMTGKRKCTDLGGLFQSMPVTAINGIIGALAISAVPLTSGFVTKSLETSAAAEAGLPWVWFMLVAASAGVFLHAGIKFPWFVFFQKDSGLRPPDPPWNMRLAMWIMSFLCILIGIVPGIIYGILPYTLDYKPYTVDHVVTQMQLLLFAGFAFFALLALMKRTLTISLDLDWFYRKLMFGLIIWIKENIPQLIAPVITGFKNFGQRKFDRLVRVHGPQGILARTWPSASMVLWVAVLLAVMMILHYMRPD
ncbi:Na(+)/H(+) antiporter subunit D [Cocleimonas flava]|uniref:Multisubunit sodium/proton antiporter MrpD subunit n=1 Tax=Cocleimonas flava TaxID=634765 RepID=A0A4R1F2E0_9GAMM|nr:Na(+)/H(+) antiporter subunit D [Cocleimonas flava]TCJ84511.1 multisubunit sodium/proton antiporter MrpD subunit [Cocleimonas flava]